MAHSTVAGSQSPRFRGVRLDERNPDNERNEVTTMILDTTAALKETIELAHETLNFGDIDTALKFAEKWIELIAAITCSGVIPERWRAFGQFRPQMPARGDSSG